MKKKIITIFILLSTCIGYGQTSDVISPGKIALGLNFSPDYSYRWLVAKPSFGWMKEIRDSTELPRLGFTTGLSLFYQLTERITLESGLQFADKGVKSTIYNDYIAVNEDDPAIPPDGARFVYHDYYLELPIKINYIVLSGKIQLFVAGGISLNYFLFHRTTTIIVGTNKKSSGSGFDGNARFSVALLTSAGIDYNILKRTNLRLEPIFRGSLISNYEAPLKQYQYSLGINLGLYYKLK
ncbi:MAG: hypothetical protein CVT99_01295 [Bacteroidetes bacterium HGW-Bacteroidetes-16]|jgi:hypothetical protein|nr:MAG: hypothetical protein CVT99_01295 [Bacteroidetes bacterium HGW-Bacteroidetes-16]